MTIEITSLVLSISAFLFTLVTAGFSVLAYIKVVGMEKSTHQVQWMPIDTPEEADPKFDGEGNELPTESQLLKDMAEKMYPDIDEEMV